MTLLKEVLCDMGNIIAGFEHLFYHYPEYIHRTLDKLIDTSMGLQDSVLKLWDNL
jgi:hypothetical protein